MLVIPTGTDAPIYHWPHATVGLIVLNVLLFFAIPPIANSPTFDANGEIVEGTDEASPFERYSLYVGDGKLHPVQWVTHNFLHFGFLHLAGNMLFLWAFGIVVEGKLGPFKYLLAYLLIGTLHGAFVQVLLMHSRLDQHAAGASAVVYGLLAVCMIWAPRNELYTTVILTAGFRIWVFQWELYYTTVALYYMGTQVLGLVFWGALGSQLMMTELGHLSGAFWGAVVGVALLKAGLVDCEGWDLFALWAKRKKLAQDWKRRGERLDYPRRLGRGRRRAEGRTKAGDAGGHSPAGGYEAQSAAAVARVRSLIESGDLAAALDSYRDAAKVLYQWPPQSDLYALIKEFHARGGEVESVPLMRDHCRQYPDESSKLRLKLAQVLIRNCHRPVVALRTLREVPAGSLPADLERVRGKLLLQAEQMREEGVIEVEGDDA
jgi:membrane associated rhomboid family serine protease